MCTQDKIKRIKQLKKEATFWYNVQEKKIQLKVEDKNQNKNALLSEQRACYITRFKQVVAHRVMLRRQTQQAVTHTVQ